MEHGTSAGYQRHTRAKTEPCDPCRKAARIQRKRQRQRKDAGLSGTYNPGNKLEEFRKFNPGLEPALKAVWDGNATPEQHQRFTTWVNNAWGLEPNKTIDP